MNFNENYIAFMTILRKEIYRFMKIWTQTILPSAITTALYFIIFGNLIGSRIGEFDGIPYINFIVPGLIMMAVITNAYTNVVSSFYFAKFIKNIEEMLVSPISNLVIILGFIAGGVARGLMVGIAVTIVSLFFTNLSIYNIWITIIVIILSTILFSLAGLINGIYAKKFDDVAIVPTFILTPLTFLGGVFYSINVLPPFWQKVSLLNPIIYMVNAFRYGILGISDVSIIGTFIMIILFIVIFFWWSWYLLEKGVGIKT